MCTGTMGCSLIPSLRAILLVNPVTLREIQPSPCAQDQLSWPTFDARSPEKAVDWCTLITFWVLAWASRSVERNRFEDALVGRHRRLASLRPILKAREAILSPVMLAVPITAGKSIRYRKM